MVEVFKIINGFAPPMIEDFFLFCENIHNIWNFQIISNETKKKNKKKTVGLEMVKYRVPLL